MRPATLGQASRIPGVTPAAVAVIARTYIDRVQDGCGLTAGSLSDTLRGVAPRDFSTRLTRRAARAGLFLTDDLVEKLSAFYALLSRWNQKINLTALADPDEAIDRLMLEPLLAARHVPSRQPIG